MSVDEYLGMQQTVRKDPAAVYGAFGADWLAEQLPGVFAADPFLQRFLQIFQDVADTVRWPIEHLEHYVSPAVAPVELLSWLARWIDLDVDTDWSEVRQREFLRDAGPLFRYRGTPYGLRRFLELVMGSEIQITDSGGVTVYEEVPEQPRPSQPRSVSVQVSRLDLLPNKRRARVETKNGKTTVIPHGRYDQAELELVISQLVPADTILKMHYVTPDRNGSRDGR